MGDFVREMELFQSRLKSTFALSELEGIDVKLAVKEIYDTGFEKGEEKGRKQGAIEELERLLNQDYLHIMDIEKYCKKRLKELELGAKEK